ncbi:MAG: hypothetical protein J6S45_06745 [Firmicutes bacterium]|nr:hypothetical protein [Bacillota bacterium]
MKKKWNVYMSLILTLVLLVGSLTGCGGSAVEPDEEQLPEYPVKLY